MAKSCEQQINWIRDKIIEIAIGVSNCQSNIGRNGAPELEPVADGLEDLAVEFERLVNKMPVEKRS